MLPILFTLPTPFGPQPVYAYGLMLGLSLISGFALVERIGSRADGIPRPVLGNACLVAAVTGIFGARLLYVLENRDRFDGTGVHWLDVTAGGVTAYGGFVGGLIGVAIYLRARRVSLAAFSDAAAPALCLGLVLTSIGCYLHGSDFGTPLPAGAPAWLKALGRFPHWQLAPLDLGGSPAFLYHVSRYGLSQDAPASLPVHPTQLYQALVGLGLLGLSLALWRNRRFRGQVILLTGAGYAASRFLLEYLRDDPERGQAFGFSSGQLWSVLFLAGCALGYSLLAGRARRESASVERS